MAYGPLIEYATSWVKRYLQISWKCWYCIVVLQSTDQEISEKRVTTPGNSQIDNNENANEKVDGLNNSNMTNVSQHTGMRSISIVFYTTVTLIFVFVSFAMFYGASSFYKLILSRREKKDSDLNFTDTTNSLYECVDVPRYL